VFSACHQPLGHAKSYLPCSPVVPLEVHSTVTVTRGRPVTARAVLVVTDRYTATHRHVQSLDVTELYRGKDIAVRSVMVCKNIVHLNWDKISVGVLDKSSFSTQANNLAKLSNSKVDQHSLFRL